MWDILDRLRRSGDAILEERAMPLIRRAGALGEAIKIARVEPDWDIVHAQYGALVGALASRPKLGSYIVSLRGSDIYWRFGTIRNRASGLIRVLLSWIACLRSDAIVVMSHAMARRVRSWPGLGRRAVHFIPDPAGDMFWPPAASDISSQLRSEPFAVIVASIQHANPVKRTWLIASAAELCQAAGMPLETKVLSGRSRDEVRAALDEADCIALASTHEGWPNVIKEALLLGRRFVSTDVGDLAEYAPAASGNRIVEPNALDFACAWVDQLASRLLEPHGIGPELAPFHPDAVALKHRLLYLTYARSIK
jgi:hypothetical protein